MKTRILQCHVTYPSRSAAEKAVRGLLKRRLIACGQIFGPLTSRYWWKGRLESCREWLVLAKTTESGWSGFERAVRKTHPYEVPEITGMPVVAALPEYLEWVRKNVRSRI